MEFDIPHDVMTRELMGYMRHRQLFDSMCMLIVETGVGEVDMCSEMLQIQRLIMGGRWEDLMRYLDPVRQSLADFSHVEYVIKKQQYLEALSWQGALDSPPELVPWRPLRTRDSKSANGGQQVVAVDGPVEEEVDMDQVLAVLKSLEPLCSQQEFNRLCNCLTYTNLAESPDYGQWRMAKGRLDCVQSLNTLLAPCLRETTASSSLGPGEGAGLLGLMALGLEYCVEQTATGVKGGNRGRRDFFNSLPTRIPVSTYTTPGGIVFRPNIPGVLDNLDALPTLHVQPAQSAPDNVTNTVPQGDSILRQAQSSDNNDLISTQRNLDQVVQQKSAYDHANSASEREHGASSRNSKTRSPERPSPSALSSATVSRTELFDDRKFTNAPPKPPVSWTVDDSAEVNNSQPTRDMAREKEPRGQSWNIDFTDSTDTSTNHRNTARISSSARPVGEQRQQQHQQQQQRPPITVRSEIDREDATVMTAGSAQTAATSITTGTVATTGTGVMSHDTVDRQQVAAQGRKGRIDSGKPKIDFAVESQTARPQTNNIVFPGWAAALDAAVDQAVIINPVLLFRESNPLRSVSLRPTSSKVVLSRADGLEDSLTLNPATTGENITLAVGSNAKSITIVDMTRPFNAISIRHELQGVHRGSIYTSDWSRDGKLLASGSNDKTIRVIRNIPMTGQDGGRQDISCSSLKGHTGTIRCLKFCPFFGSSAGSVLASGGAGDCRMRLWDVQTESCTALAAHQDHIHGISWVNSEVVLSGCDKGVLLAHDIRAASVAWSTNLSNNGICHLGNLCDNLLISGHTNGEVNVFDMRTRRRLSSHILHSGDVRSVAMWTQSAVLGSTVNVDAGHLFGLTTSFDGQGSVWRFDTQRMLSGNANTEEGCVAKVARLVGHTDKILSSVYSPHTHDIITSGADGNVLSWSASNIASTV